MGFAPPGMGRGMLEDDWLAEDGAAERPRSGTLPKLWWL